MSAEIWTVIGFFAFVLASITAAGYVFVLRPALAAERRGSDIPAEVSPFGRRFPEARDLLAGIFRLVGEAIPASEAEAGALRKRLIKAGYRLPSAVPIFSGIKCASGMLLALLLGWAITVWTDSLSTGLLLALGGAAVGYGLPGHILGSLTKSRQRRIRRALPDALDLMVLCVEAGQSLDQAVLDTSQELKAAYPDLSIEFALVHLQLRAGKGRADALRSLVERNNDPELRQFVNLLIQSDRFGTSIGPALRSHSRYLRRRRKQQAEEAARKLSIKLLAPIFFLIFPCMLAVTAGPAILQIFTQLLPMLGGGE